MRKTKIIFLSGFILFTLFTLFSIKFLCHKNISQTKQITGMVIKNEEELMIKNQNHVIYTFDCLENEVKNGDYIRLEYNGNLDELQAKQNGKILSIEKMVYEDYPEWKDEGLFKNFYDLAYKKLQKLSLDEKIGQLFLVRYPINALEELDTYHFSGFVFYEKDFRTKTEDMVKKEIENLQNKATVPLLTAVDEEGGKIIRISSNPLLVSAPFKSSKELYDEGGFAKIKEDTITKSKVLKKLGLNLNLAPVVDVSTNPNDYIYERAFGKSTDLTATYAKTVILASKDSSVSYTLKHFPGYAGNTDTHNAASIDTRSYSSILEQDIPPFEAGIEAGAEAVLVGHNIITSIENTPASLSPSIHNILRNHLDFTGIIIADDIDMGGTSSIQNKAVQALLAGNDLVITTNYQESINEVKTALQNNTLSEEFINRVSLRVLAWKYYKGLLYENEK